MCGQFVLFLYLLPPPGTVNSDEKKKQKNPPKKPWDLTWFQLNIWKDGAQPSLGLSYKKIPYIFCGQILTQPAKNFI